MQIKVSTRVLDQRYINDYKLAMKQGKITIADLHILALSELAQCYNDCARGYLFNNPRITLTADQNKRLEELLFVVGI